MKKHIKLTLGVVGLTGLAFLTTLAPVRADEFDALRNDPELENGVLIVAIADVVRDNCSTFELRRARAAAFFWGLVNRGRALGYSNDQIRAYVDNDADKERVEARARQWFLQEGANFDQPETVCEIARAQIAAQTVIGRLIREE